MLSRSAAKVKPKTPWRLANAFRLLFYSACAFQVLVSTNHSLYLSRNPGEKRVAFQEYTHVPIQGWSRDLEQKSYRFIDAAEILVREQRERDFPMPSFNVISQNYLQRDLSDWVIFSINPDVCTYRSNFTGSFNISSACFRSDNIRYEIKRQKLEGILREDPGFREEWGSLTGGASDSYDKFEADVCSLATQMDECGEIPSLVYNPLFKEGSDLRSKVALLQEHGLIPKEFLDHVKLSGSALATRANIFLLPAYLKQKDAFLKRYPGTMFESNMRLAAAQVYRAHGMNAEAEAEIKDGLRADLRDRKTYQMLLAELQILYRQTGRGEAAALVGKAVLDTYRMYWVGDIRLLSEGVNPFLKEKGIL